MKKFLASVFLLTLSIHAMDNNTENLNLTQNTNAKSTAIVVYNQRGSEAEERLKALVKALQSEKSDSGNNKSNLLDPLKFNLLVSNKIIMQNLITDKNGRLKPLLLQYASDLVLKYLALLYYKIFVFNKEKKESELRFYPNSETDIFNFNCIATLSMRVSCIHLGNMETVDVSLPIFRNVKELYLKDIKNISGSLSELSNLDKLSLDNVNITNLDLSALSLKELSLINMHLDFLDVETNSLHLENSICDSFGLKIINGLCRLSLKHATIRSPRVEFRVLRTLILDGKECIKDGDLQNLTTFRDLDEIVIKNMKKTRVPRMLQEYSNFRVLSITLENVSEAWIPEKMKKLTIIGDTKSINGSSGPIKINWKVDEIFVRNNSNEIIIEKDMYNLDLDLFSSVKTVGKIEKVSFPSELSKKIIRKHGELLKKTNEVQCAGVSSDCPPLASIKSLIISGATKLNISNFKKILPNLKKVYLEDLKDCCIDLSSYDSIDMYFSDVFSTKIIFPKGEKFQNVVSDLFRQAGLIDTTPLYLNVSEGDFEITSYFDRFLMTYCGHIYG